MQTNNFAQDQASYHRWTWIVALILAFILLWMLLTGSGPTSACCNIPDSTPVEAAIPIADQADLSIETPVDDSFSFTATQNEVTSTGDASKITWLAESDKLKLLLSGEDLRAQGDDKRVLLSGIVDSEVIKLKKGVDAQVLFGSAVTIDNQLVVKAVDLPAPPETVKLYFDTGKTTLPNDANTNLAAIIDWLMAHPEAKVVLSGYHDPSGNKASNEKLAKKRAESVEDALEAAGIDDDRIEKRKPQSVDGGTDLAEARRVEVSIE